MVEAKDALHVKPRAWFTAWHAELAWMVSEATETGKETVEAISSESTVPDAVKVAARKVDVGDSAQAHFDHPQKMRRISSNTTCANPNQVPIEIPASSPASDQPMDVEQHGAVTAVKRSSEQTQGSPAERRRCELMAHSTCSARGTTSAYTSVLGRDDGRFASARL